MHTVLPRLILFCLAAVGAAQAGAATEDAADRFEPMDVFDLEWADDPQVSPDGETVAYVRHGYDVMKDRPTARIWLVDVDGTDHRPLTDGAGRSPRWSPDGGRIAFLAPTEEGVEVYMHWLAGNRTARITQLPESPSHLTWSPDGRQLAFDMFVPKPADPLAELPKAPEGADWAPPAKVIEQVNYRADGAGYLKPGYTQVFVLPADGGTARQVTRGDYHHDGGIAWAPDGRSLYVSANRRDDWEFESADSALHRIDLASGEIVQLTDRFGPEVQPALSPDGRLLAFTGYEDRRMGYHNASLSVLDLESGEVRTLTGDLDRSVAAPVWDERGRGLYVTWDDHGTGVIGYVPLRGERRTVAGDLGGTAMGRPYSGGSFHADGGVLVYTQSRPDRPADLAVAEGDPRRLTSLNDDALGHVELAAVERFEFASSLDDRPVEAWVAKPPGFEPGKRYPLILEIHGGPFAAYGPHFASEIQLYAAAGYVVVYVNPRGSTSYGNEFANLIHHDYPGGDYHDLMSAVDHAVEAGWADPDALYVTGGSGGGILTAWIVTHTDRFRAAVSQKPVINWYSMTYTSDIYTFLFPYWFAEAPWKTPEEYLRRSPLSYVDRVTTPTMLLTGENDFRTPMSESEQFYQALKLNRVDSALVRIPEASHGIAARPSHLISKVAHVLGWFGRYAPDAD
ncbi:MAG: peptidase S9 family protein [Gammaproteobacteria bacterium]|nr:peptidase S9 family protein [Gammaproteobacteria bacterium]